MEDQNKSDDSVDNADGVDETNNDSDSSHDDAGHDSNDQNYQPGDVVKPSEDSSDSSEDDSAGDKPEDSGEDSGDEKADDSPPENNENSSDDSKGNNDNEKEEDNMADQKEDSEELKEPETKVEAPDPVSTAKSAVGDEPDHPAHKKSGFKHLLMVVGLPILALLVLAGAIFGGYVYYLLNKPETIALQSVGHTFDALFPTVENPEASSFSYDGTVVITNGDEDPLTFTVDGSLDVPSQSSLINLGFNLNGLLDLMFSVGMFGDETFVKAGGLDGLGLFLASVDPTGASAAAAPLLGSLNEQWVSVDASLLASSGLDFSSGSSQVLSEEDRGKLTDAFIDNPFVDIEDVLESETVDGVEAHHYKVRINTDMFISWLEAVKNIGQDSLVTDELIALANDVKEVLDALDYQMEIWIGKDDKFMRRVTFDTTIPSETSATTIDFDLNMNNYNQPVSLEKPAGAISILDLLQQAGPLLDNPLLSDPGALFQ